MSVSTPLQILAPDQVVAALRTMRERQPVKFSAFYSSQLGGVVTDPALMVLPFDDHMVHRGHGIFDTAALVAGSRYRIGGAIEAEARRPPRGDARHHHPHRRRQRRA